MAAPIALNTCSQKKQIIKDLPLGFKNALLQPDTGIPWCCKQMQDCA